MSAELTKNADVVANLGARLERIPVATRSHKKWVVILAIFYFFDQFDIAAYSYTAPALKAEWGLSVNQIALGAATPFIGMFIGAIAGGWLADRYGRRPVILGGVVLYSLLTLSVSFTSSIETVAAIRGVAGIALQAVAVLLMVYIAESLPGHLRGRYLTIMATIGVLSVPVVGFLARMIVPAAEGNWRWIYAIGSLGLLAFVLGLFQLPETARWLVAHGRVAEAESIVRRLEDEAIAATGQPLPGVVPQPPVRNGSVRDLLQRRYTKRTSVIAVSMVCGLLALYGFNAWLPTLLVENGFSQSDSLTFSTIVVIAAAPGALLAYPFIDRFDRKLVVFGFAAVLAVVFFAFGTASSYAVMLVTGCLISGLLQAMMASLYTYTPTVYPTHLRGVGSGIASGFGRIAGVAGSFIIAAIVSSFGYEAVFVYLATLALVCGLVLALGGERTRGRSMEDLDEVVEMKSPV